MQQLPRTIAGRVQLAAAAVLVLLAFTGSAAARIHGAVADTGPAAAVADVQHLHGAPTAGVTGAANTVTVPAPAPEPAHASAPAPAPAPAPASAEGTFTLGDLAAGRVPQDVQDRFWQAQLEAIRTAPCPDGPGAGTTAVTLFLGADEAWTARLRAATEDHATACAA